MKIDGLGILLVIIIFPVILVVSYYIQLQVKTIATENNYNTKLLNATYDALSAFEINTANEELSSVSDSLRSIIEASTNTFFNTLATNLGMSNASKEMLQPYVPAMLYTLYDGYYIYTPAEVPVVYEKTSTEDELTTSSGYHYIGDDCDGTGDRTGKGHEKLKGNYGDIIYEKSDGVYTINKSEAKTQVDYILKPYTQYSARYEQGDINVTINYTLDNYLNIEGTVGDVYYTKTGYLIYNKLVKNINIIVNGSGCSTNATNEDDIKNKILGIKTDAESTSVDVAKEASVTVNGETISAEWTNINDNLGSYKDNVSSISEVEELLDNGKIDDNNVIYEVQKYKAIAYYASAACFSDWVYTKLGDLEYGSIKDDAIKSTFDGKYNSVLGSKNFYTDYSGNGTTIFDSSQDPESSTSNFNTHKLEVIKNSIKYNLNLVISNYKNTMNTSYNFSLPIIEDSEWDKILSNVSIVSLMQGFDCGLDIYNNYEIATSTNNELMVDENEIYYVPKSQFNDGENSYYFHRIDCSVLAVETEHEFISFTSKEIKYDKIYNSSSGIYEYDHKNLACYSCINTGNYKKNDLSDDLILAKYIGVGCQKQGLYKMNASIKSEGYKVEICDYKFYKGNNYENTINNLGNVKELEITFSNTSRASINNAYVSNIEFNEGTYKIANSSQTSTQTIFIDVSEVDKFTLTYDGAYEIDADTGKYVMDGGSKKEKFDEVTDFTYEIVAIKYIYN